MWCCSDIYCNTVFAAQGGRCTPNALEYCLPRCFVLTDWQCCRCSAFSESCLVDVAQRADFGHVHGGGLAPAVQDVSWGALGDATSSRGACIKRAYLDLPVRMPLSCYFFDAIERWVCVLFFSCMGSCCCGDVFCGEDPWCLVFELSALLSWQPEGIVLFAVTWCYRRFVGVCVTTGLDSVAFINKLLD